MNLNPKGVCKKHNVGKLEYGTFSHKAVFMCPVCNSIKGTKIAIKDTRKSARREIGYLKQEIHTIREKRAQRIQRLQENLNIITSEPMLVYNKDIESRRKFLEEHPEAT